MHMPRFAVAVVTALAVAGSLHWASGQARGADPIVVGEFGSMTGSQATFGVSTDNGIKLAVDACNAKGGVNGRPIKLVVMDDAGKQQEAISCVTHLVEQDHAVAILGEVASSLSLAGGQVCQRLGVPMISPSSTNAKVTQIGDMISRVCFIDSFQGMIDAKFAVEQLKLNTAAILYNKAQAYSTGLKGDFGRAFTKMGGKILAMPSYQDGDNDYSAQLTAIKDANVQFVYIPGYYTDVVNIARQARQMGITVPLIGSDGWSSDQLKNAGTALDGCYFSDHYAKEDNRPIAEEFRAKYKAMFNGAEPDSMAACGYDAALLLFDAASRAKSLSGADLAAAINSTKDLHGVTGDITIDAQRNAKKGLVMQQVKNGEYSFYSRVEPN
jgi:branched-chain amino acid transport system substrate-binding protein